MTESIEDIYGWGSVEWIKHHARAYAWCVKHKEPFVSWLTTGGFMYVCQSCMIEKYGTSKEHI
jgi:hypothetical protein